MTERRGNQHILGEATKIEVVQSHLEENVDWLKDAPVCELLSQYHINHAGIMQAEFPLEITRKEQSGTFMLACFSGEGRVLADGRWIKIKAGEACLLPPFVTNAIKCTPDQPWGFCWVRYIESRNATPIVTEISPVRGDFKATPMLMAIRGLITESTNQTVPAIQHHWVELIHNYVLRFAQPHQEDDRLWKLWKIVEQNLDYEWTLSQLAKSACLSDEHLRRLCKKQLGRSPVQHLTFLRMQQACHLLATTNDKVDFIASSVGYINGSNFSNAFTKWVGLRPSEYRKGR